MKLYEYTVSFDATTLDDNGQPLEAVVIEATDANHALSEMLDEYGHDITVASIIRGALLYEA